LPLSIAKNFVIIKYLLITFGKNRGSGREPAGKPQNPRIAVWHRPAIVDMDVNSLIDNYARLCYMGRTFAFGKTDLERAPFA
jgi:hypothetical protein